MYTIGIIRESRTPPDSRVAITPVQCAHLAKQYGFKFRVQPSPFRIFKDEEYQQEGIALEEDLSPCDIIFGVKEIKPSLLLPHKTYFFFSHTTKMQPHNRVLLQTALQKHVRLIDYEELTDTNGKRLVAFGQFAGLVGAYNALLHYGRKYSLYSLKPAHQCFDAVELYNELKKVQLPPVKMVLTGTGRVGGSARYLLQKAGIPLVEKQEYLTRNFDTPVFVQLTSADYHHHADGRSWDTAHFHHHPEQYVANFLPYSKVSDVLVAGAFWNPKAPRLFSEEDVRSDAFKIRLIADITCDINGSIPTTVKASTIPDPVYDIDRKTFSIHPGFSDPDHVTVMAVDNLPCELARDASESFGEQLMAAVFPNLATTDPSAILPRATLCSEGKLLPAYKYLEEYVVGKQ